jgi:ankyrin repeat protein
MCMTHDAYALIRAVRDGQLGTCEALLSENATFARAVDQEVERTTNSHFPLVVLANFISRCASQLGTTALMFASLDGNDAIASLLLENEAFVNAHNKVHCFLICACVLMISLIAFEFIN